MAVKTQIRITGYNIYKSYNVIYFCKLLWQIKGKIRFERNVI